jgi:chromosome segregation ATPase
MIFGGIIMDECKKVLKQIEILNSIKKDIIKPIQDLEEKMRNLKGQMDDIETEIEARQLILKEMINADKDLYNEIKEQIVQFEDDFNKKRSDYNIVNKELESLKESKKGSIEVIDKQLKILKDNPCYKSRSTV